MCFAIMCVAIFILRLSKYVENMQLFIFYFEEE